MIVATKGFEPLPADPESAVLPLHHVAIKTPRRHEGPKMTKIMIYSTLRFHGLVTVIMAALESHAAVTGSLMVIACQIAFALLLEPLL